VNVYTDEMLKDKQEQFHKFNDMLSRWRFEAISEFVKSYDGILEIGIGSGQMTPLIYKRFFNSEDNDIFCVDPDPRKIRRSKRENNSVHHTLGRYEDIDYSIGTIICSHTLEHVDDPYIFLNKCYDDLRDNGVLIVTVPNALSLHKRVGELMGISNAYALSATDELNEHKHIFDQYKLGAIMQGAGFEIVAIRGLMLKPFPSVMMQDMLDEQWFRAFWEIGKGPALVDYCSSIMVVGEKR
jgi:SAM-dependent methyltransferase